MATKRTLTSHGFHLHFFFKHVFQFMSKTFLFLVCNFPQLFQLFIFNHILWIIAVPFFLVYQNAIYCFFVWTHCFHWKRQLQIFQLFLCLIVFLQHMAYTCQKYWSWVTALLCNGVCDRRSLADLWQEVRGNQEIIFRQVLHVCFSFLNMFFINL